MLGGRAGIHNENALVKLLGQLLGRWTRVHLLLVDPFRAIGSTPAWRRAVGFDQS